MSHIQIENDGDQGESSDGIVVSSDDELIAGLSEAVGDHIQQEEKKQTYTTNQFHNDLIFPKQQPTNAQAQGNFNQHPEFSVSSSPIPQIAARARFPLSKYDDYYYYNLPHTYKKRMMFPGDNVSHSFLDRKLPSAPPFGQNYKPQPHLSSFHPGREPGLELSRRDDDPNMRLTGVGMKKKQLGVRPHSARARSHEEAPSMPLLQREPHAKPLLLSHYSQSQTSHPLDPFSPTKGAAIKNQSNILSHSVNARAYKAPPLVPPANSLLSSKYHQPPKRHPLDPFTTTKGKKSQVSRGEDKVWLHDKFEVFHHPKPVKATVKTPDAVADASTTESSQNPNREKRKRKRTRKKSAVPVRILLKVDLTEPIKSHDANTETAKPLIQEQLQMHEEVTNSLNSSIGSSDAELVIVEEITDQEEGVVDVPSHQVENISEQNKILESTSEQNLALEVDDSSSLDRKIIIIEEEIEELSTANEQDDVVKRNEDASKVTNAEKEDVNDDKEEGEIITEMEEGEIPGNEEDELLALRLEALNSTAKNLDNKAIRADLEEWVNEDLEIVQNKKYTAKGILKSKKSFDVKKTKRTKKFKNLLRKFKNSKPKSNTPKPLTLGAEILRNNQLPDESKREQRELGTALKKLRRMPAHEKSVEKLEMFVKLMHGEPPRHVLKVKPKKKEKSKASREVVDNYDPVEMEVDSTSEGEGIHPPGTQDVFVTSPLILCGDERKMKVSSSSSLLTTGAIDEQAEQVGIRRRSEDYDEESLREILLKQLLNKRQTSVNQTVPETAPAISTNKPISNVKNKATASKPEEAKLPSKRTVVISTAKRTKLVDPRLHKRQNSPTNFNLNKRKVNNVAKVVPLKKQRVQHARSPALFPRHQPVVITISDSSDEESAAKKAKNVDMTPSTIMQSSVNNLIEDMRQRAANKLKGSLYKGLEEKVAQIRAKLPNKKNDDPSTTTTLWPFDKEDEISPNNSENWPFSKDSNTDSQTELDAVTESLVGKNSNDVLIKGTKITNSESVAVTSISSSVAKSLCSISTSSTTVAKQMATFTTKSSTTVAKALSSSTSLKHTSAISTQGTKPALPFVSLISSAARSSKSVARSSKSVARTTTEVVKSPTAQISVMAAKVSVPIKLQSVVIPVRASKVRRRSRGLGVAKKSKAIKKAMKANNKARKELAAKLTVHKSMNSPVKDALNSSVVAVDNDLESIRKTIVQHSDQIKNINKGIKVKMQEIQTIAMVITETTNQNAELDKEFQRIKRLRKELRDKIHKHKVLHKKALRQKDSKFATKKMLLRKIEEMRKEYQVLLKQREKTYVESRNTPEKILNKKKLIETKNTLVEQQQELQKKINELKNQSTTKLIRVNNNAAKKSRRRYSLSDTVTKQLENRTIKQEKPDTEIFGLSKIVIGKQSPVKTRPEESDKHSNKEKISALSQTSKSVKPKIAHAANKVVLKPDPAKSESLDASFTIRPISKPTIKTPDDSISADKDKFRKLLIAKLSRENLQIQQPQPVLLDQNTKSISYQAYLNSTYFYNYILHPLTSDQPIYISSESENISLADEDSFESSLVHYRSYRLSPFYRRMSQFTIGSNTFSHKINPHKIFCRYDLTGVCKDPSCHNQHTANVLLSHDEILLDLMAYHPDLIGINESNKKSFTQQQLIEIAKTKAQELCGVSVNMVSAEEYYVLLVSKINQALVRAKARGYCTLPPRIIYPEQMTPDLSDFTDSEESKDLKQSVVDPDDLVEFEERYCAVVDRNSDVIKQIIASTPHNVHKWLQVSKRRLQGIRNCDNEAVKKKKIELVLHNLSIALEHNPLSEDIWCFYLSLLKQRVEINPNDKTAQRDFNEMLNEVINIVPLSMNIWKECFLSSKYLIRVEFFYQQLLMNLLSRKSNDSTHLYSHWLLTTLLSYAQLQLDVGKYETAVSLLEAHSRNISLKYQDSNREKCPMTCADLCRLWLNYIHLVEFMELSNDIKQNSSHASGLQSEVSIVMRIPRSSIEVLPDCEITLLFNQQRKMNNSSLTMQNLFRDAVSKCSNDSLTLQENTSNCLTLYFALMNMFEAICDFDHGINICKHLVQTFSNHRLDGAGELYHHEIMLLQDRRVDLMLKSKRPTVEITQTFDSLITDEPWNAQLCIRASDYQMKNVKPADYEAAMMYYEMTLAAYFQFEAEGQMSLDDLITHYQYLLEQSGNTTVLLREKISSDLELQKPYLWICYCNLLHMKATLKEIKLKSNTCDLDFIYDVIKDAILNLNNQDHKDLLWMRYIDHCVETLTTTSCRRVDHYTRLLTSGVRDYLTCTPVKHLFEKQFEYWDFKRHNKMIFHFISLFDCQLHSQLLHSFTNTFPHNLNLLIRACQYFASRKEYSFIPSVTWPAITSENCVNVFVWKILYQSKCKQGHFLLALQTAEKSVERFLHNKEMWREYLAMLRAFASAEDLENAKNVCRDQLDADPEELLSIADIQT